MKFHIITLFPEVILPYLNSSILKRAQDKKLLKISIHNPRDFTTDKHKTADDRPYGGGPGMVMKAEPILKAVEAVLSRSKVISHKSLERKLKTNDLGLRTKIIILSPRGKQFTNEYARKLAKNYKNIVLISGHYEGVDARVKKMLKAEELSVGPYVLTGGEIPALVVVDAVTRQIEGVLGKRESLEEKRIASKDVYTRPETLEYRGKKYKVPKVLLSGDHRKIETWRQERKGKTKK